MRLRAFTAVSAAALLLASAFCLSACTGDMWCEETATGARVDEQYCDVGGPGYEWKTSTGSSSGTRSRRR